MKMAIQALKALKANYKRRKTKFFDDAKKYGYKKPTKEESIYWFYIYSNVGENIDTENKARALAAINAAKEKVSNLLDEAKAEVLKINDYINQLKEKQLNDAAKSLLIIAKSEVTKSSESLVKLSKEKLTTDADTMLTSVKKEVANANNKLAILANSGTDKLKINAETYLKETITSANKANDYLSEIFKSGIE